jgi:hypothetical protein
LSDDTWYTPNDGVPWIIEGEPQPLCIIEHDYDLPGELFDPAERWFDAHPDADGYVVVVDSLLDYLDGEYPGVTFSKRPGDSVRYDWKPELGLYPKSAIKQGWATAWDVEKWQRMPIFKHYSCPHCTHRMGGPRNPKQTDPLARHILCDQCRCPKRWRPRKKRATASPAEGDDPLTK